MVKLLDEAMNTSAYALKTEQKLAAGTNLAKSFIVESNWEEPSQLMEIQGKFRTKLQETDDSQLTFVRISKEKKECPFILDAEDDRFWVFHTLESSAISNWAISGLVKSSLSRLDHVWLSRSDLTNFASGVDMSEFSAKFESAIPENQYEDFISRMSIRVWGGASRQALDSLQKTGLGYAVSLHAVRVRFELDNAYADERLTRKGVATASGTSAVIHMQTVDKVKKLYREQVDKIEKDSKSASSLLDVTPHMIRAPNGIPKVKDFVERLSRNMHNLRIFGLPLRISSSHYSIPAIDLHNGDKIDLDISPDGIRVLLWPESCGNTLLRLESQLQKYVQADLEWRKHDAS